jgi:hypothetical protein
MFIVIRVLLKFQLRRSETSVAPSELLFLKTWSTINIALLTERGRVDDNRTPLMYKGQIALHTKQGFSKHHAQEK